MKSLTTVRVLEGVLAVGETMSFSSSLSLNHTLSPSRLQPLQGQDLRNQWRVQLLVSSYAYFRVSGHHQSFKSDELCLSAELWF